MNEIHRTSECSDEGCRDCWCPPPTVWCQICEGVVSCAPGDDNVIGMDSCKCPPEFVCGTTLTLGQKIIKAAEEVTNEIYDLMKFTGKPVCGECGCAHSDNIDCKGWVLYCAQQCIMCSVKKTPWQDDCYYCDNCEQIWMNDRMMEKEKLKKLKKKST